MSAPLNEFQTQILNRILPTQTFADPAALPTALRKIIEEQKEQITMRGMSEYDFNTLQRETPRIIFQWLRDNEFYYEREGGVYYITDRGKQLRAQGTLEKYIEWMSQRHNVLNEEMKINETRGYTDEAIKARNSVKIQQHEEKKKKTLYPAIIILAVIIIALVAKYMKLF